MSKSKAACDVFISRGCRDAELSDAVAQVLRSLGLTVFAEADVEHGKRFEDEIWEAMAESQAVVVIIPEGEPTAWITFELGAAKAWNKPIYAVAANPATARLPVGVGDIPIYPFSRVDEIATEIKSSSRTFTDREIESLLDEYLEIGLPVDQLMLQPAKLHALTARFNRLNRKRVTAEELANRLLVLRKQGMLPRRQVKTAVRPASSGKSAG